MKSPMDDDERVWRALTDPVRRKMLDELVAGPRTTSSLVGFFEHLCRTGVMKHLDVLERAGLVVVKREGRVR